MSAQLAQCAPSREPVRGSRRFGDRRRWTLLTVVPAAALLALALVAPAASASYNSTPVPLHPAAQVGLSLLGGSADGYAVQMYKPASGNYGIFTGGPGDPLTERTIPAGSASTGNLWYLGVVGQQLGYYRSIYGNPYRYEMHRLNVLTGVDTTLGTVTTTPVAYTTDSWIAITGGFVVSTRFDTGAATRLAATGSNPFQIKLTTDGLLIETANADRSEWYLDLVDFGSTEVERVASEPNIHSFGISPTTITWYGNPETGRPEQIMVRERSGGPVATYTETDDYADPVDKIAGYHGAGFLYSRDGVWRLRTISTSGVANTVVVQDDSSSLQADGDRWLIGTGGRTAQAGVYEVRGDTPTQVASVTPPNTPVTGISFSAGKLYYSDAMVYDDGDNQLDLPGPRAVWTRPVTGLGSPSLGTETELAQRTGDLPGGSDRSMEFSAARGVVSGDVTGSTFTWRLLDRFRTMATVQQSYSYQPTGESDDRVQNLSGPYLVAAGHVYDPAGKLIYSRPGAAAGEIGAHSGTDDIYGPRLVYPRESKDAGYSDIWLRDLDRPKSRTNPGRLATVRDSSPLVAIWGNTAAWQSGARELSLRTLSSTKVRKIKVTGPLLELTIGEGALAWNANAKTYVLDTLISTSKPIAYAAAGHTLRLDNHYLARQVSTGAVVVYSTGFTEKYRPRLIGAYAPAGFTPNGDGKADTWNPQFDLSKPVKDLKLVIRSAKTGSTLRTLVGTAADASVRDLAFDGRGKSLANGTYRWQLTGTAVDGEGAVIGIRGESKVTGTVTISRVS
jgi:hypothetical protein